MKMNIKFARVLISLFYGGYAMLTNYCIVNGVFPDPQGAFPLVVVFNVVAIIFIVATYIENSK